MPPDPTIISMAETTSWKEECWQRVATADVEDRGAFYDCVIYKHKVGGGYCLYFGEEEYEGMGKDQSCGIYSFKDGVLQDQDGDIIQTRNVVVGRLPTQDYVPSSSSDEESDCEEFHPVPHRRVYIGAVLITWCFNTGTHVSSKPME